MHHSFWTTLTVCAAVLICSACPALAADASKLILQNGTIYEDVTYIVDREYKIIKATKPDWERTFSFLDIAFIYDADGNDVTEDELGMVYRKIETSPRENSVEPQPPVSPGLPPAAHPSDPASATSVSARRKAHPWGVAVKMGGNFSIPTSTFYDGFTSGPGFEVELLFPAATNLAIRLSASKAGIRDDPDQFFANSGGSIELVEDNVSAHVWRFAVAANYYDWPRWRQGGRWAYHIYSGIGVANHALSGEYVIRETSSGELVALIPSDKDITKLLLTLGFGVMTRINKSVGLEGAFEFDGVAIGSNPNAYSVYSAVEYAFIFDFKLGVVWLF